MTVPVPLSEISILEWSSIGLMLVVFIILLALPIYMIYTKCVRHSQYRISLILLYLLFVLDQLLIAKSIQYFYTSDQLLVLHFVLANLVFLLAGLCSTSVLSLYQSMIPFITPKKINIIRAIMILGFLANIIVIFGKAFTPNWYSFLNTIFFLSFILGIALYDEFQNIYLVIKVYNSIRAKPNQVEHFQKLIYMNISMILIDILAIGSFIMGVFTTGSWQRIGFNISTALQGSHGIVLLYLFIGMIELKFSERIAMQKNEKKLKTKKKNEASLSRLGPDTNLNN